MNDPVWEHVSGGRHVLLLGPPPPPPPQWLVVTVRCDGPRTTAGPLELARGRLLDAVGLGEVDEPAPSAGSRPFLGVQPIPIEARFVDACNRVVGASVRPSALVLDAVDKADEDTLESLVEILARPLWLSLPLVLVVRDAFPTALEEAVRVSGGVVLREAAPAVPDAGVAVPAPRGGTRPPRRPRRGASCVRRRRSGACSRSSWWRCCWGARWCACSRPCRKRPTTAHRSATTVPGEWPCPRSSSRHCAHRHCRR